MFSICSLAGQQLKASNILPLAADQTEGLGAQQQLELAGGAPRQGSRCSSGPATSCVHQRYLSCWRLSVFTVRVQLVTRRMLQSNCMQFHDPS